MKTQLLILIIVLLSSCKKEYNAENCPAQKKQYYYYNYSTNVKCCNNYISPCDGKTIQEFVRNCPSDMQVGYY